MKRKRAQIEIVDWALERIRLLEPFFLVTVLDFKEEDGDEDEDEVEEEGEEKRLLFWSTLMGLWWWLLLSSGKKTRSKPMPQFSLLLLLLLVLMLLLLLLLLVLLGLAFADEKPMISIFLYHSNREIKRVFAILVAMLRRWELAWFGCVLSVTPFPLVAFSGIK